jgi:hypothetical protein
MKVYVHGICCKIKFVVLPEDALLGLDWFAATQAYADTNNKILHFPSRNILLETEMTVYEEEQGQMLHH